MKLTVALEPLPLSGTASVSRKVPNSLVATSICTGISSSRFLPMRSVVSFSTVAVIASLRYAAVNLASLIPARDAVSSSEYIWL